MPDYVLRNPNLPDQPIVVTVAEGGELAAEYETAGWQVDDATDAETLLRPPEPEEPAEPEPTEQAPVSLDLNEGES